MLASASPATARPPKTFTLSILHNNDGESALLPTSVDGVAYGDIARFVAKVQSLRLDALRAGHAAVMLNSGDNFLAGTTFQASREEGAPFYDALALRLVRYDALAIGNHEFAFGRDVFNEFVEAVNQGFSRVPFVSANLDFTADPQLSRKAGDELVLSRRSRRGPRVWLPAVRAASCTALAFPTWSIRPSLRA